MDLASDFGFFVFFFGFVCVVMNEGYRGRMAFFVCSGMMGWGGMEGGDGVVTGWGGLG